MLRWGTTVAKWYICLDGILSLTNTEIVYICLDWTVKNITKFGSGLGTTNFDCNSWTSKSHSQC